MTETGRERQFEHALRSDRCIPQWLLTGSRCERVLPASCCRSFIAQSRHLNGRSTLEPVSSVATVTEARVNRPEFELTLERMEGFVAVRLAE